MDSSVGLCAWHSKVAWCHTGLCAVMTMDWHVTGVLPHAYTASHLASADTRHGQDDHPQCCLIAAGLRQYTTAPTSTICKWHRAHWPGWCVHCSVSATELHRQLHWLPVQEENHWHSCLPLSPDSRLPTTFSTIHWYCLYRGWHFCCLLKPSALSMFIVQPHGHQCENYRKIRSNVIKISSIQRHWQQIIQTCSITSTQRRAIR